MFELIGITLLIGLGIYYVTTLDFEVGSGISEEKSQAKEAEYVVAKPEATKELQKKWNNEEL